MEVYLSPVTEKLVNELISELKERYSDDITFTVENVVHLAVVKLHKKEVIDSKVVKTQDE